ncbi:Putative membrane protein YfjD [hydrothermal vent metagenome]|uniref:Membrane protein YfjD n=1 Tax=hydrothermal vent metagenome TaxID=652676 RepID=A0A3B1AIY3_9ZZZZ
MSDIPLSVLFSVLALLIVLSALFSGSETALMTLNRYRLRHLADRGHPAATRAHRLLQRPDRLIGLILLGNNFVNILASSIATIIALRMGGESAIALAAGILTFVILIFAEVTPKTLAAIHPERLAFPAALIYTPLLKICYPIVWIVNFFANGILKTLGVSPGDAANHNLSPEELRTVVLETGAMIPQRHKSMLLSILDLERTTVEDIMIPRNEMGGIDLDEPLDEVIQQLQNSHYTRLPVYDGSIDNIVGTIHVRHAMHRLIHETISKDIIRNICRKPYFIPEGTPLNQQLLNFQRTKNRIGLVVDEYGDLLGLVTLEDLLEEIVGEFTTNPADQLSDVQPQDDGSYLIDGSANIRELVRTMQWELPTDGPKTLNGLIIEYLETIPEAGTSLLLAGYPLDIIQVKGNAVKTARFYPHHRKNTNRSK